MGRFIKRFLAISLFCLASTFLYSQQTITMMVPWKDTTEEGAAACAEARWFFENDSTDEEGNHDLTTHNGATYSASIYKQGSYGAHMNGSNYYFSFDEINYGDEFTVSLWVYINDDNWDNSLRTLYSSAESDGDGFWMFLDGWNDRVQIATSDGVDTDYAHGSFADDQGYTWHHLVFIVHRSSGYCQIYANNSKISTSDSTIRSDFDNVTDGVIGIRYDMDHSLWGYEDAINISLWSWDATDVSTEYNTAGSEICE